ncbi:hypothetical protein CERZMDRAFT_81060 [Cercospora zeae-maydis SCOH1-5]|uniref:DUF7730 domain-containing protein n=1 Tax=Cercospora zeae-maydis SCOH1-5 TaxID=717836 RepID=A0A6A6FV06_9PEZI|nr:hypothetical protein CERZMDRAFT_81060 [Cercospora zeae-maydis SCOH1-5]
MVTIAIRDEHYRDPEDLTTRENLLGLPLTCKQICFSYAETIDTLYTRPTFCFMQAEQIVPFHERLSPERWNAITSIEFNSGLYHRMRKLEPDLPLDLPPHPGFAHRPDAWHDFWTLVNTMQGLERVIIRNTPLGYGLAMLSALTQVQKRMEVFDIYLTETQCLCDPADVDLKTAQFNLILPSGQRYVADPPLSGPAGSYGGVMERLHQIWWQT